jgi:hypothetical protein
LETVFFGEKRAEASTGAVARASARASWLSEETGSKEPLLKLSFRCTQGGNQIMKHRIVLLVALLVAFTSVGFAQAKKTGQRSSRNSSARRRFEGPLTDFLNLIVF